MGYTQNLSGLSDQDLSDLVVLIWDEQAKRKVIEEAPQDANNLAQRYADAVGLVDGDPWVQPHGAYDAYPLPSTVTHNGKTWENLTPANVWQPPTGWREVVAGGGPPEWVQPVGSVDAYSFGDRVTFEGHIWRSVNPGEHTNVWSPTVYPAAWVDEGPVAP